MKEIALIFPHQLFKEHPALKPGRDVLILEYPLFFGDWKYPLKFHKMKLTFHRASMKSYENLLISKNFKVSYLEYKELILDRDFLFEWLIHNKYECIHLCEPDDYLLKRRITHSAKKKNIELKIYSNPSFLCDHEYLNEYFESRKGFFQHHFYVDQRKRYNILIENNKPIGGKWSLDSDNRKSIPANFNLPSSPIKKNENKFIGEAKKYVDRNFSENPGVNDNFYLPIDHNEANIWLENFLHDRLNQFGDYQDAIIKDETLLFHSLLSPLLNSGLLTPEEVLSKTLDFIEDNPIPLNSAEGFIRQLIGWREFIRAVYLIKGTEQRNSNFWNNKRKIPQSFYLGTTGLDPIDSTIRNLIRTGYNHHIERLMILGNFMLLAEFDPNEVYSWFMTFYIDAYDWVMVPNVYGMSQFADGGFMSTKPYISSSNYIRKMSNYKGGEWTEVWDSLFWNFISKHREYFANNVRTRFLSKNLERMSESKLKSHIFRAEEFLEKL